MSAGVLIPLSPTTMRSLGTIGANCSLTASVVSNVRRSRLLMPISRERIRSARSSSAALCTSTSTSSPTSIAAASMAVRGDVVHGSHDDQDRVGAERPRLEHLVGLVHKILAHDREVDGDARILEVPRRTLEKGPVGEHRQAGRARRPRRRGQAPADRSRRG